MVYCGKVNLKNKTFVFISDSQAGPTQSSEFGFTAEQPFALPDLHIDGKRQRS